MNQDEIIEMANKAGMDYLQYLGPEAFEKVVVFSKLVAQHEREACAKIVEESSLPDTYSQECLPEIANDIRARGQE
jgi:hypothetical protein